MEYTFVPYNYFSRHKRKKKEKFQHVEFIQLKSFTSFEIASSQESNDAFRHYTLEDNHKILKIIKLFMIIILIIIKYWNGKLN